MFFRIYKFKNGWHLNLVVRLGSFWMGIHRSAAHDSYCVAVLPCIVFQFINSSKVPLDCKEGE